jgi:hypothetical protein
MHHPSRLVRFAALALLILVATATAALKVMSLATSEWTAAVAQMKEQQNAYEAAAGGE